MVPHSQPNHRRTRVWFQGGRLMTNNPAAFQESFYLPATPPSDDGLQPVSLPLSDIEGGC